jgi:DNA-binding beta-propeller fold protein YncE
VNCTGAWGIALNRTSGILYVADSSGGKVRGYDVTTWAEVQTFTPSQVPCDVAVDKPRGFIYTTAPDGSCAYAISGIDILVKIDIATGTETNVNLGHGSMGAAVDCATGLVYVTGGCSGDNLEVWDTSTTPWTQVQDTGVIGNPAGICVPQAEIGYGPAPVPVMTPVGLIALIGLLSIVAALSIRTSIRKRR